MPTKVKGSPPRVLARLSRIVERSLDDGALSLPQYRLLAFLSQGDWAASALADKLDVSRPSVTSLVDGLVKRGLVQRRPDPADRRRIDHVITVDGRAALERADAAAESAIAAVFAGIPGDVARDAHAALCRLHEAMDDRLKQRLA